MNRTIYQRRDHDDIQRNRRRAERFTQACSCAENNNDNVQWITPTSVTITICVVLAVYYRKQIKAWLKT